MALTTGSLFYNLPEDSTSTFTRPGAIFFPILFFAMNKMSETTASFMGRRIVSRHKRLSFSRPSAFAVACTVTDVPLVIISFSLFQLIYYFMTGQQVVAGKFFTSWIILVICILCFASLYRMIGAWCRNFGFASQLSGWITMVYLLYGGETCRSSQSESCTDVYRISHPGPNYAPLVPMDQLYQSCNLHI
jgi:ATP-binding cassette subfamily G (WHITE) protein 2 (SNQ2)